jgi:multidrug efflux pump subunit AcrB
VPDVSKIEVLGAQDEKIFIEFSMQELATLGIDRSTLLNALQAQNIVKPAGTVQTGNEALSLRVSGAFLSEQDISSVNFAVGGRMLRLSDIARVRRTYSDPPEPLFRVNGEPAIGLAIAMRDGGDILALGKNLKRAMAELTAGLPVGIEPRLVADQASAGCHCRSAPQAPPPTDVLVEPRAARLPLVGSAPPDCRAPGL